MKNFVLLSFVAVTMVLTGCQTSGWGTKQTIGTGSGAVLGGLAGSQVGDGSGRLWATGAGVLLGAFLGGEVGASLDRADKVYMGQAQQRAYQAPVGETIAWNNPETGNSGTYTPVREGVSSATQRYCREYQQTIVVGGQEQAAFGTACQMQDGSWEVVN
jgi:surface antigen